MRGRDYSDGEQHSPKRLSRGPPAEEGDNVKEAYAAVELDVEKEVEDGADTKGLDDDDLVPDPIITSRRFLSRPAAFSPSRQKPNKSSLMSDDRLRTLTPAPPAGGGLTQPRAPNWGPGSASDTGSAISRKDQG